MFAGDLFDLVQKRRGFAWAFQSGLVFREPLSALFPKRALADENLLHFARIAPRGKIGARLVERTQSLLQMIQFRSRKTTPTTMALRMRSR